MNSYALIIPMFIIHHKMILINSSKQEQSKYGPLKKKDTIRPRCHGGVSILCRPVTQDRCSLS